MQKKIDVPQSNKIERHGSSSAPVLRTQLPDSNDDVPLGVSYGTYSAYTTGTSWLRRTNHDGSLDTLPLPLTSAVDDISSQVSSGNAPDVPDHSDDDERATDIHDHSSDDLCILGAIDL